MMVSSALAPAVLANSSSSPMIVYSVSGSNNPKYSTWNGSAWSSGTSMPAVGANPNWVLLRNCPTRNETACMTLDANADVNVMFHDGSSWSSAIVVNTEAVEPEDRNCDVAYEQSSGDALVVYYDGGEGNFGYRTYNGSSLSSESDLAMTGINENEILTLYPKPNSDQIMMVTVTRSSAGDPSIHAILWNGSSWDSWTTIETNGTSNDDDIVDFAWETSSGDGLLVYGENGSSSPRYRTWMGGAWSSEGSLPSTGGAPWYVRLAADPASNQILFGGVDATNHLTVSAWNGSSWDSGTEVETSIPAHDRRAFDIAYQPEGTAALLAYAESAQSLLRYRTWNGSAWSSEQSGTDLGEQGRTVELRTGFSTGEIFIAANDDGDDIELMRWNGSSLSSRTQIEGTHGGTSSTEPFMVAPPVPTALVPANVPYANDFESAMGPQWSNTTRTSDATYTNFAGRHWTEPLKLALNTTIGETYSVSFDLYAIDSWDGNHSSYGPDLFNVRAGGTTIFSKTICHGYPSYGQSYPYPYDQRGSYGYNSSYLDAIFRKVEVIVTADSAITTLTFQADFLDPTPGLGNESWGIDNVAVTVATFVDVSSAKGFNLINSTSADTYGGGIAWADFDGDGDLDVIVSGSTARLWFNTNAGASFSNYYFSGPRRQWALLDLDHDGDIDVWTGCAGNNDTEACRLNDGVAGFTDGGNLGFSNPSNNEGLAAADVNGDGWCDIVMFSGDNNWIGRHTGSTTPAFAPSNSAGDGLNGYGEYGDGDYCSAGDVNNDRRPDFFYHYNGGMLFISDGNGAYTRNNYGISVVTGSSHKMGSAWADYDNDGDLDLFCPRTTETCTGYLWRNDRDWAGGTGDFTNVTSSAGLNLNAATNYTPDLPGTRSCCWGDYDNDGDLDLFIAGVNGNNYLYQNQGDGTFQRTAVGTTISGVFIDCAFVDYDNDGDLDLFLTRENAAPVLLENRINASNFLKVRVLGGGSGKTNKAAVGTRVELWNSTGTTLLGRRDIGMASGYGGVGPQWAHFGGVTPTATYQVKVYFQNNVITKTIVPNTASTTIGSTVIPKMLTIEEPATARVIKWSEVPNKA